jgi:hypothetical protein
LLPQSSGGRRALAAALAVTALGAVGTAYAAVPGPLDPYEAPAVSLTQPLNSQSGNLRMGLTCNLTLLGQQRVFIRLNGTFPTLLSHGQQFTFEDGNGSLEIPPYLGNLIYQLGGRRINFNIPRLNIGAENATPAKFNIASPPIIVNTPVKYGQTTVVPFPSETGTFKVGPFTAGSADTTYLTLQDIAATMNLYDGSGKKILFPITAKCAPPNPAVVLGAINTGSQPFDGIADPKLGHPNYEIPTDQLGKQVGALKFPLVCTLDGLSGTRAATMTQAGVVGTVYAKNERFYFEKATANLNIPSSLVDELKAKYPGSSSATMVVTKFDVDSRGNVSPATTHVAATPIPLDAVPLTSGQAADFRVPGQAAGQLKIGPFIAGDAGRFELISGGAAATITLKDASGGTTGAFDVDCAKPSPAVAIVGLVSDGVPAFRPAIQTILPGIGSQKGGDVVVIHGEHLDRAREIKFGTAIAPAFTITDSNTIAVTTPKHIAGRVPVTVEGPGGISALNVSAIFTFGAY